MNDSITTSVLLIAFNRPESAQMVFDQIKKVRPPHFYLAVDGPRPSKSGEEEKCLECQSIANQVDWECEVHTLFRKENVGCGFGPAGAISWAFETTEELIVLEDDCLPSVSFFYFCDELIKKYKNDKRIWIISGLSIHSGADILGKYDYTFSRFAHTWGWATWKDRWNEFDMYMRDVPQFLAEGGSYNVYQQRRMSVNTDKRLRQVYDSIDEEVKHSWDTQWGYTRLKSGGVSIVPKLNMITNIGAVNGTHNSSGSTSSNLPSYELKNPLNHPQFVICNTAYDNYHYNAYINLSLIRRCKYYLNNPMLFLRNMIKKFRKKFIFTKE